MKHYNSDRGEELPASKISSQCPHVLLVEAVFLKGKSLGSEEGENLGSGLHYQHRRVTKRNLY